MSAASGEAVLYQRLRAHLDFLKLPAAARGTHPHAGVARNGWHEKDQFFFQDLDRLIMRKDEGI